MIDDLGFPVTIQVSLQQACTRNSLVFVHDTPADSLLRFHDGYVVTDTLVGLAQTWPQRVEEPKSRQQIP